MCLQTFISLQLWLLIQARLCGWITKTTGSCHTADGRNEREWTKTAPCCLPPWTLCPREHSWCKTENNLSFHRFTPLLLHLLRAHRFHCFFIFFMSPSCAIEQEQPAYLLMKFLAMRSRSHSELRWIKNSDGGCWIAFNAWPQTHFLSIQVQNSAFGQKHWCRVFMGGGSLYHNTFHFALCAHFQILVFFMYFDDAAEPLWVAAKPPENSIFSPLFTASHSNTCFWLSEASWKWCFVEPPTWSEGD